RFLVHCNTILSASSVVFRRDEYLKAGGADESLVLCGDWKMWASMSLSGGTICHVGQPLNYYRFHPESVTEKTRRNGTWANQTLQVVRWIVDHVDIEQETQSRLFKDLAHLWAPAVLDRKTSLDLRWRILRNAVALDQRALRKLVRPALTYLRLATRR